MFLFIILFSQPRTMPFGCVGACAAAPRARVRSRVQERGVPTRQSRGGCGAVAREDGQCSLAHTVSYVSAMRPPYYYRLLPRANRHTEDNIWDVTVKGFRSSVCLFPILSMPISDPGDVADVSRRPPLYHTYAFHAWGKG